MQFGNTARDLIRVDPIANRHFDKRLHELADFRSLNELGQFRFATGRHQDCEIPTSFGRADDRGDQVRYFVRRRSAAIMHITDRNALLQVMSTSPSP